MCAGVEGGDSLEFGRKLPGTWGRPYFQKQRQKNKRFLECSRAKYLVEEAPKANCLSMYHAFWDSLMWMDLNPSGEDNARPPQKFSQEPETPADLPMSQNPSGEWE